MRCLETLGGRARGQTGVASILPVCKCKGLA